MQYFVVLEDTKELRWQAELLYESIRLLDLTDQFLIAICPSKGISIQKPRYPNVVYFDNLGRSVGCPHLNKVYGLAKALESGSLRQPFVLLDTDMFLLHAIPPISSSVAAQQCQSLTWDNIDDRVKSMTEKWKWDNLGGVYVFNDVPVKVFEDAFKFTYELYRKFGNNPKWHIYGITLSIVNNDIKYQKTLNYEMPLVYSNTPDVQWDKSCIVHYKEGFPPYFKKERVFDSINFSFDIPLPFKVIMDIPIKNQPNVAIMQTLCRSWLDSNLTRVHYLL
jgi:hypothetical protein